jgi:hypothetical protein
MTKVFGIGLAKTSVTSLGKALEILGYTTIQFPRSAREIEIHDACVDISVADAFEELDRLFPGSKFIYTTRDTSSWIASSRTHWRRGIDGGKQDDPNMRAIIKRLYGVVDFDEERFREAYLKHDNHVRDYFRSRPDDLLILEIRKDADNWAPLCNFLSCPRPDFEFPFANRTKAELMWQLDSKLPEMKKNKIISNQVTEYIFDRYKKYSRDISRKQRKIYRKLRLIK